MSRICVFSEVELSSTAKILEISRELLGGLRQGVTEHTIHYFTYQLDLQNNLLSISVKDVWSTLGLRGFEKDVIQSIGNSIFVFQ